VTDVNQGCCLSLLAFLLSLLLVPTEPEVHGLLEPSLYELFEEKRLPVENKPEVRELFEPILYEKLGFAVHYFSVVEIICFVMREIKSNVYCY